jgi:hypothetical protein
LLHLSLIGCVALQLHFCQEWGSWKAQHILTFSAKAFSIGGWGEKEAWSDFYDEMLANFWLEPSDPAKTRSANVAELQMCEKAALKRAFELVGKPKDGKGAVASMEDALATVRSSGIFERMLAERPLEENLKRSADGNWKWKTEKGKA